MWNNSKNQKLKIGIILKKNLGNILYKIFLFNQVFIFIIHPYFVSIHNFKTSSFLENYL